MKTKQLEAKRDALVQKREELIGNLGEAVRARGKLDAILSDILLTNDFLDALDKIATENTPDPKAPRR